MKLHKKGIWSDQFPHRATIDNFDYQCDIHDWCERHIGPANWTWVSPHCVGFLHQYDLTAFLLRWS